MKTSPQRPRRSDARRNRERLLVAARTVFAANGAHASLQGVAREAGVGIGTLYRHFPSREALYTAVYEHEVDHLVAMATQLTENHEPITALRTWLHALVDLVATKTGMASALAITADTKSAVSQAASERLIGAIGGLLDRCVAHNQLRNALAPRELLHAVVGMCLIQDAPDWQSHVANMIDVLIEGLRSSPRG